VGPLSALGAPLPAAALRGWCSLEAVAVCRATAAVCINPLAQAETFIPLSPSPCWLFVLALEGPGLALERWRELSGWGKDELVGRADRNGHKPGFPVQWR